MDEDVQYQIIRQMSVVAAAAAQLGPVDDLSDEMRKTFESRVGEGSGKVQNIGAALEAALPFREKIRGLLERPHLPFDDEALRLTRLVETITEDERILVRPLFSVKESTILGRYASRTHWLSIEENSPGRVLSGLIADALHFPAQSDQRDVMLSLVPHHFCAMKLEVEPEDLFDQAATFAGGEIAQTLRTFGRRRDVTLAAFGWVIVETEQGLRFRSEL